MATTVTSVIDSGGGGDYTSLINWAAALPANLVTSDEQHVAECIDETYSSGSTLLTLSGHTTDATRNIIVTTNGTASFKDKAGVRSTALLYNASNGTAIVCTGGYTKAFAISDDFVTIRGLQFSHTSGSGAEAVISFDSGADSGVVDKCIVKGARRLVKFGATSGVIKNSLLQLNGGGTGVYSDFNPVQVRNCTIVNVGAAAGTGLNADSGSTIVAVNNALFNLSTYTTGTFTGSDYNATDNSTFPAGSNNVTSLTFADQFENTSTDFRAVSTGDLQAGTPDSTYAPDDISDQDRDDTTPWIGCWEVAGGGGGSILPLVACDMRGGLPAMTGGMRA